MVDGKIASCDKLEQLSATELDEIKQHTGTEDEVPPPIGDSDASGVIKTPRRLIDEETKLSGSVSMSAYAAYIRAVPPLLWVTILIALLSKEGANLARQLWLKLWSESSNSTAQSATHSTGYWISRYIYIK